jgi:chromosome condensin MukBEF ATPase and DNA-binding subunit MukB
MPRAYNDHSNHDRRDERKLSDFDAVSKRVVSLATQGSASIAGLVERQAQLNAADDLALVNEYEALAERIAAEGMAGKFAAMLASGLFQISPALREQIECDPEDFARRVSEYAYGQAMANTPEGA